jgi:uncharacterized protein (DUF1697 family)
MAVVVFLRGINVGGHRRLRPGALARELGDYDVVNVGAAGTLVVRKCGPRPKFRADLLRRLPFDTEVVLCEGRDLIALERENPFGLGPPDADLVRFVSVLSRASTVPVEAPLTLPATGQWFVRVLGRRKRFVFGVYRRHMKTIGYLGQIDELFGAPATTRNWNTILSVTRILKGGVNKTGD